MNTFRIKSLSLEGFRSFKKTELVFPESNVLLLIGNNGKGKSSILDSIAILLSDFVKRIRDTSNGKNGLSIQRNDVSQAESKTIIKGGFEDDEQAFYIRLTNSLEFSKNKDTDYTNFVIKFKHRVSFSNLPILVYYKSNRFFKPAKDFRPNLLYNTSENAPFSCYDNAFSNLDITFEDFQTWFRLEEDEETEAMRRLQDFASTNYKLDNIRKCIKLFFTNLEDHETSFSDLRVLRTGAKSKLVIKKDGLEFELEQLSDGERMLLLLVCDIARRLGIAHQVDYITGGLLKTFDPLSGSGIVLIDEIDMHLHPKWQRNVLPALIKTFPNIQFIATTHSAQVLSRAQRDSIRVLDNGKILAVSSNPIGRDANAILEEIQQVSKRPNEIEMLIDSYFARINNNDFEAASGFKKQLLGYLDTEDPVFARGNAMMERKKMLML